MAEKRDIDKRGETSPEAGGGQSSRRDISAFLNEARQTRPLADAGRLVIALDATMSRQPTWDRACAIQGEMFTAAGAVGRLTMQLVYFRGFGECAASKWVADARSLAALMTRIDCRGGQTQIRKVLRHTIDETRRKKVQALVYIGDCVEESIDDLCARAGELGLLGVPAFIFQEGGDAHARVAFQEIARLTKGAWFQLSDASAGDLAELLKAAAVYAAGGRSELERLTRAGDRGATRLLAHLR
ncbi:VWA domain-containing protein [Stappia indica]|uniref:VWA domain-containing protein n=1 Tax=Stappia indica TaxID=538381 RepID=UPI001CD2C02C|nr:VWA domain-containing protein [Stappia indica]MCA1300371.1 VWA domain-containing protein [Stappia indica]